MEQPLGATDKFLGLRNRGPRHPLLQPTIKITPANTRITYFNTAIGCNKK
jgi:hypothetical protein